ncbi:N-acetylmuramoyl-L-alanine amidase [Streptomyces sp. AVP053U2]|nr:N-acetylmuramoyl-L-alanine amidase [Streptomyces sp. AVP053U2]ODA69504.1 N-acetylmuramoyl-L-alanine amidase [Streptomyces sp. AVP053U2]
MATPLTAARLIAALKAEGVQVVEVGDWRDHNRNHKGPWGPVHGVMIHHTVTRGSARTVELCRRGYSGLPGPLCHGVITKDGRVHLIGYGRANHAGSGDGDVLRAVIAEEALPPDNEQNTDGNRHFYGFECENLGDGEDPWPAAQLEAIEKVGAALARAHGWNERSVIGHLEWQPGKVDPRGFTMNSMRARIAARLDDNNPQQQQEDDVALTDDDIRKLATRDGIFKAPRDAADYNPDPDHPGHWWAFGTHVVGTTSKVRAMEKRLAAMDRKLDQLTDLLQQLANKEK